MKSFKLIGFALAAFSCMQFTAAQEAAATTKLSAVVQLPGGKTEMLELERADGEGTFYYIDKGTAQLMTAMASTCKTFYIQTPNDMANALRDFYGNELAAARKGFAAVKKKYAAFAGLPGSPCTMAALHEITCAVRLLDVAGVKSLTAAFPGEKSLTGTDAARLAAARVVALISDKPDSFAAIKAAVENLMKDKKLSRELDSESYGWLRYALGRAAAAMVPAEQVQATIAEDKVKAASVAVDFYCEAIMSMHGSHKEMPADALNRSLALLWAMPGVQEYAGKVQLPMTKPVWNAAPANFRDAVAMAHYIKAIYPAPAEAPNALADKLDAYYFNMKKGAKAEK